MHHDPDLKVMYDGVLDHLEVGETARFDLERAHQAWGEMAYKYHQGLGTTLKPWADKLSDRFDIVIDVPGVIVTATRKKP